MDDVSFQFAAETTDDQRHQLLDNFLRRFGGLVGAAGVIDPVLRVQPGASYSLILKEEQDPQEVAMELRSTIGIDAASVRIHKIKANE